MIRSTVELTDETFIYLNKIAKVRKNVIIYVLDGKNDLTINDITILDDFYLTNNDKLVQVLVIEEEK